MAVKHQDKPDEMVANDIKMGSNYDGDKQRESQIQSPAFNTNRDMASASIRVTTVFEI